LASLHVRNIDEEVIRKLKERAVRNGRSAEAEHREILKSVLFWDTSEGLHEEGLSWEERAERLRRMTAGRQHTPSELLIREDRDSR
jgi:plasmid stability protein